MAEIGIQTWGSEGDIRPFLALAAGLAEAGHEVTVVITSVDDKNYQDYAQRFGFTLTPVASPVIDDYKKFEDIGWEIFFHIKYCFKKLLIKSPTYKFNHQNLFK